MPVGLFDDIGGHQGAAIAAVLNVAVDFGAVAAAVEPGQNDMVPCTTSASI
jgi:hypothetical protein